MKCPNEAEQIVQQGYGYKTVYLPCGSVGLHGKKIFCESCQEILELMYPQGWREVPGDTCPHGCYIGYKYGPDYICQQCEEDEE